MAAEVEIKTEYERIRQSGRDRLLELSRPKNPKVEWWTNVGPNVMWGTQEMLWPIPSNIKEASSRVQTLATPKKNFQTGDNCGRPLFYYSCGRPSMIWEVKAIDDNASERVLYLAKPKEAHKDYKQDKRQYLYGCGRTSPIWQVRPGAKSTEASRPRTEQLAKHKIPHREFLPARQVETVIPQNALSASISERVQSLATPKQRPDGPFRSPEWPVTPAAKNASAKSRSLELARPKGTVDGYQLPREEMWPVSRAAKRANASGRVQELCKPVVRASMDHVQFNPDAFVVKELALKGTTPNIKRIEDLAQPIQR